MFTLTNRSTNRVRQHRDYIDQLFTSSFEDMWDILLGISTPAGFVESDDGTAYIQLDVPGMKAEDIEISLEKGVLSVKGERKDVRRQHKINSTFNIPAGYDPGNIVANLEDGVMTLKFQKLPETKTEVKKIAIQSGAPPNLLADNKN